MYSRHPSTGDLWVDEQIQTDPDAQFKHVPPWKSTRVKDDPILSDLTGTVVLKSSWPGIGRRENEANMFRNWLAASGRCRMGARMGWRVNTGKRSQTSRSSQREAQLQNTTGRSSPRRWISGRICIPSSALANCSRERRIPGNCPRAWADSLLAVVVVLLLHFLDRYWLSFNHVPIWALAQGS